MSEPNRSVFARVKRACLWVSSVLLVACAGSSPHSRQGQWRLDTETAGKLRHAATVAGEGASSAAPAAAPTVASLLAETAPILVTVLGSDNAVGELEERLLECARRPSAGSTPGSSAAERPRVRSAVRKLWWTAAPNPSPGPCSWGS